MATMFKDKFSEIGSVATKKSNKSGHTQYPEKSERLGWYSWELPLLT